MTTFVVTTGWALETTLVVAVGWALTTFLSSTLVVGWLFFFINGPHCSCDCLTIRSLTTNYWSSSCLDSYCSTFNWLTTGAFDVKATYLGTTSIAFTNFISKGSLWRIAVMGLKRLLLWLLLKKRKIGKPCSLYSKQWMKISLKEYRRQLLLRRHGISYTKLTAEKIEWRWWVANFKMRVRQC